MRSENNPAAPDYIYYQLISDPLFHKAFMTSYVKYCEYSFCHIDNVPVTSGRFILSSWSSVMHHTHIKKHWTNAAHVILFTTFWKEIQ